MISSKTIEEVFEVAIIEDVISEFVVLKKSRQILKLRPFPMKKLLHLWFHQVKEFGRILALVKVVM